MANRIVINGKEYNVDSSNNITIINGELIMDGKKIRLVKNNCTIEVYGDVGSITCEGSVNCNNVKGNIKCGGSVNCDDVSGDINCGGSVNADCVGGNINAGGSVII